MEERKSNTEMYFHFPFSFPFSFFLILFLFPFRKKKNREKEREEEYADVTDVLVIVDTSLLRAYMSLSMEGSIQKVLLLL